MPALVRPDLSTFGFRTPVIAGSPEPKRRAQALDFARVLTIARIVSRATTATTWAPRMTLLRSTAGRHITSSPLMRNAPTGRALMPKPPPEPLPWPSGPSPPPPRATLNPGGRDHGHAVPLIGFAEHALDGERVPGLRDDVVDLHDGLLPAPPSSHLAPRESFPQSMLARTPHGRDSMPCGIGGLVR